ncbi:MAG: JAB domain-containing protein [Candidatus Abyssobacteria bacterium SURF_17]|uniref:JAB domain-containing protein n=1 Tax=Candidatus Abyssobacteria bacterium SURF_17 TaxID=2093361 RepID=A0A419F0F1_9BACT|nr:MAG: JAB domain-containing protein [Candidatus Abyssubacteria bacterium SURF_17]
MSEKPKTALIREMPPSERPRERLARRGPSSLKTSELLATLFRTGTRNLNALELADTMLNKFGSLTAMSRASTDELKAFGGIGFAKAVEIQAAFELGRRLATEEAQNRPVIKTAKDVARLMAPEMQSLDREHFKVLFLNTKNHVLQIHTVSIGSLNASVVHPRECFGPAIAAKAAAIILVHNHPSGDVEPSPEDLSLTRRLIAAGELLGIKVLDHVIIAGNRHLSLIERGVN